jgi:hypothetical protein
MKREAAAASKGGTTLGDLLKEKLGDKLSSMTAAQQAKAEAESAEPEAESAEPEAESAEPEAESAEGGAPKGDDASE